jgi:very-short-patch-repair endonuclease
MTIQQFLSKINLLYGTGNFGRLSGENEFAPGLLREEFKIPYFTPTIVEQIAVSLGLAFTNEKETAGNVCFANSEELRPEFIQSFAPIDLLDYIYEVLHSPTYREKYKEFLKIDFPHVPYPTDTHTFWKLVALGGKLRKIHLLESPTVEKYITQYPEDGDNVVVKPSFVKNLIPNSPHKSSSENSPLDLTSENSQLKSSNVNHPLSLSSENSPLNPSSENSPLDLTSENSQLKSSNVNHPLNLSSENSPLNLTSENSQLKSSNVNHPLNLSSENSQLKSSNVNHPLNLSSENSPPLEGCPQGGVVPNTASQNQLIPNATIKSTPIFFKPILELPYNIKLKTRAKELRQAENLSEVLFWMQVTKNQFYKIDFDRQRIIGNYIVDFYVKKLRLVLEIDGSSHDTKEEYDKVREEYLLSLGLKVYRIPVVEVLQNIKGVMRNLEEFIIENYGKPNGGSFEDKQSLQPKEPPRPLGTPPKEGNLKQESKEENLGRVYINPTQYFDNVPEVAWNFYIGGYQPAQKWLKDRKDLELGYEDIIHYQKIIVALSETDRIMKEIDTIEI